MNKRDMLKKELIENNNNDKYISDKEKLEYYSRLFKAYVKKNKVKRFIYQYLEGDGNELLSKFFNVYSSSRICFELYSWLANDEDIDDIEFEYHLPSMRSSSNIKLRGSNMDVYYVIGNNIYFIESKFTEALNNKNNIIPDAYYKERGIAKSQKGIPLNSDLYYRFSDNGILVRLFPNFVEDVIGYIELYRDSTQDWFDVRQEIAHLFGICQYIYKNQKKVNNTRIHFYNVVYDFKDDISLLAVLFRNRVEKLMEEYIELLNLRISFEYDYKYMQDIYKNIPYDKLAFGSDMTVKEILSKYFKLDNR